MQSGQSCYNTGGMKLLWFVPLAFIAGVHGFIIFAVYLAVFLTSAYMVRALHHMRVDFHPPVFPANADDPLTVLPS